ncbi:MAG: TrkA family potassium uptake protein [Anaerolineales bacterium]|nr:TrkA family potassium uptake protein [Anaerolineales bacterium]
MNYIVVGCGRVGAELAYRLYQKGHHVAVIDQVAAAFENLPHDFQGRVIEGEALNQNVLHRAGIEEAHGLAIVTSSDSTNLVVAHAARTSYNLSNIVVRNYNPQWRSLFESFNLQVVSSSSWGAQRVEELLYHSDMRTIFSAGNGEVEIYEFSVPENWAGRPLGELVASHECSPVGLTRVGRAILPSCETILEENDVVLVSATFNGIETVRHSLRTQ